MSKTTFITTYRGSLCDVATISRYFLAKGFRPRSRNEVIDFAVSELAKQIKVAKPELAVFETNDALALFEELGFGVVSQRNRSRLAFENASAELPEIVLTGSENALSAKALANAASATISGVASGASELSELLAKRLERDRASKAALANPASLPMESDAEPGVAGIGPSESSNEA